MDYPKLLKDLKDGKINTDDWIIIMDNDDGYWQYTGPDEETEVVEEEMTKKYGSYEGYQDVGDILRAIGFNAEPC